MTIGVPHSCRVLCGRVGILTHEKNPRHRLRIHNVVSAPSPHIVFNQRIRKPTHRALPRYAIPWTEIYQQIRPVRRIRPRINLFPPRYIFNNRTILGGIRCLPHTGLNRIPYPVGFSALFQNSFPLAPFEIQINSAQPCRVRVSSGPVHFCQPFAHFVIGSLAILKDEQLVLP